MSVEDSNSSGTAVTIEAILRQVIALRSATGPDDQLAQLLRMVDSATWSAPVPITVLVDGALIRGALVPSEVSAAYLDDVLDRSASAAVSQLEPDAGHDPTMRTEEEGDRASRAELARRQVRAFSKRIRRRPFSTAQARIRQRNAKALIAINNWHQSADHDSRLSPFDMPGDFSIPGSPVRDVIPYLTGQRALTLADVKVLVAGEWIAIPAPVRVTVSRIGAWSIDH
jgi:hypothetical protein